MIKPIKKLGQNFLQSFDIRNLMVESLNITDDASIIEIGPGPGILTDLLVEKIKGTNCKLIAVEFDQRFVEKLQGKYKAVSNVQIVNESILTWLPAAQFDKDYKIIGSLPYYITSPILHDIIKKEPRAKKVVLLVQKEVAKKIVATAPDSSYLSSFIQIFFNVSLLKIVEKEMFYPVPKVDSAVVVLELKRDSDISYSELLHYEEFLHKVYSQPRKMLKKVFDAQLLTNCAIDSTMRPQHLTLDDLVKLFRLSTSQ